MPKARHVLHIARPPEALFALSQDYAMRTEWDPFVREIRFLDGATAPEVGARVWVRARNGMEMTVRYVSVWPPTIVAVKMVDGPRMFEAFGGVWRFSPAGEGATAAEFEYGFRTRWGLARPLVDRVVSARLSRDIQARLAALKCAAEETDILERLAA